MGAPGEVLHPPTAAVATGGPLVLLGLGRSAGSVGIGAPPGARGLGGLDPAARRTLSEKRVTLGWRDWPFSSGR